MKQSLILALGLLASASALHAQDTQKIEGVIPSIGYSRAIQVGNTVYISGLVGMGDTMEKQLANIYAQLPKVLERFGATMNDLVKETAFTTDMEGLKAANDIRKKAYGTHFPAATWVQISRLYMEQAKIEIEFIAVVGSGPK